jgi:hypothetical protein
VSRWRVLVAGLFCEICGGSIYIVSLYSAQFQRLWYPNDPDGLRKIESMIFAANLGNWLPFAGFFYDDPTYGGPRNAVLVGVLLTLVGYGGLFLCAVHDWRGSSPSTALLHALWFLWGHGSGYFDCASISTNAFNFPDARGSAVGLVGSFYGLSGSVLTKVYAACFAAPARSAPAAPGVRKLVQLRLPGVRFVGFLAVGLSVLGAAMAPLMARVNFTPPMIDAEGPRRRFQLGFSLVVSLALMNAAVGMLPPSVAPPPDGHARHHAALDCATPHARLQLLDRDDCGRRERGGASRDQHNPAVPGCHQWCPVATAAAAAAIVLSTRRPCECECIHLQLLAPLCCLLLWNWRRPRSSQPRRVSGCDLRARATTAIFCA